MEDRVRIYELSRRMNIPNQEIIQTLRELGFDVKSHSSTVDSNAVGLLIARLGKKKEDEPSGSGAKKSSKSKPATKASPKVPPVPEKKKVKPRVLSRYRKKPEPKEGEESLEQVGSEIPQGPGLPAGGPAPLPASHISSTPRVPRPTKTEDQPELKQEHSQAPSPQDAPALIERPEIAQKPAFKKEQEAKVDSAAPTAKETKPQEIAREKPQAPKEPPSSDYQEEDDDGSEKKSGGDAWSDESKFGPREIRNLDKHFERKQKEEQAKAKKKEREGKEEGTFESNNNNNLNFEPESSSKARGKGKRERKEHQRTERPMAPSVPIRVAAPSMRATPPRPPKSHRHSAQQKNQKKEEEKQKEAQQEQDLPKIVTHCF